MFFRQTHNTKKTVLVFLIFSTTSLFSANLKDIEILISKINKSKKAHYKERLLTQLRIDVDTLNQRDYYEAQFLILSQLTPVY